MRYLLILCALLAGLLLAGAAWAEFTWEIDTEDYKMTTDCYFCDGPCKGHEAPPEFLDVYYKVTNTLPPVKAVELAYWYTNWYGEYSEEQLRANVKYVDRWEIKIGSDPERPGKFIVWYIGKTNSPCLQDPHVMFYVDSLADLRPTPEEMED